MAQPFLDLDDVGAGIQGVHGRGRPRRVRAEAVDVDSDLLGVELEHLVYAVRGKRRVGCTAPVIPDWIEQGRGGEGALRSDSRQDIGLGAT